MAAKIVEYVNYGGLEHPWNFLHPRRKSVFDDFLSDTYHNTALCETLYKDAVYTKSSECVFIKDYTKFIIDKNAILPGDYLSECTMERSSSKIRDYLGNMRLTIDKFNYMGLSNAVFNLALFAT